MTITKNRSFNKIVWAVDALEDNIDLIDNTSSLLQKFEKLPDVSIQPVYVLGPALLRGSFKAERVLTEIAIRETMQDVVKESGLKKVKDPVILKERGDSNRSEVNKLLEYCEEHGTSLIVTSTHARKGIARMVLGSFAETLLLLSPIPVLFVSPENEPTKNIERIFFPTDFGNEYRRAAVRAMDLAAQFKASLNVYCGYPSSAGMFLMNDAGFMPMLEFVDLEGMNEKANALQHLAKEYGLKVETKLEERILPIVDAIIQNALKVKPDLIAIAAKEIPKLPTMIGSITRQLVRRSPCPIYVYRPIA